MLSTIASTLETLKAELPPLRFTATPARTAEMETYFDYYGISWDDVTLYCGHFLAKNKRIAGHVFLPQKPIATVFYCHGYSDHVCSAKYLIRYLLDNNFAVAAFDHLGHGLSEGKPGYVHDFLDYVYCLESFIATCGEHVPKPFHLMGHSLGGAVSMEYLFRHRSLETFDHAVLLAPLVRLEKLLWTQIKYILVRRWIDSIPRVFTDNTSHEEFLEFIREQDPLQLREFPVPWMKAYQNWYNRVQYVGECEHPVTMIVGDQDKTVDWRYTLDFIPKKFPNHQMHLIPDAAHHLPGEGEPYRHLVFHHIINALLEPSSSEQLSVTTAL